MVAFFFFLYRWCTLSVFSDSYLIIAINPFKISGFHTSSSLAHAESCQWRRQNFLCSVWHCQVLYTDGIAAFKKPIWCRRLMGTLQSFINVSSWTFFLCKSMLVRHQTSESWTKSTMFNISCSVELDDVLIFLSAFVGWKRFLRWTGY